MSVLLDKWDAAELFSKIIERFNRKHSIFNLRDTGRFESVLKEYCKKELNHDVTEAIFGNDFVVNKKTNETEKAVRNPTAFYELCRQLSHGEPVVISDHIFKKFCHYARVENFAADTKIELKPLVLNKKQRQFEDTFWWVYFFDQCTLLNNENKPKFYQGVSRAMLHLKLFGKAELTRLKKEVDEKRIYTGIYRVCKHDEYLVFKMKTKHSRERDLRMLYYIGPDKITLALGLSSNTSESTYARTVMIEPVEKDSKYKIGFYSKDLPNCPIGQIPEYVWEYFKEPGKNIIRLPQKRLTSREKLSQWLEKNNEKLRQQINS